MALMNWLKKLKAANQVNWNSGPQGGQSVNWNSGPQNTGKRLTPNDLGGLSPQEQALRARYSAAPPTNTYGFAPMYQTPPAEAEQVLRARYSAAPLSQEEQVLRGRYAAAPPGVSPTGQQAKVGTGYGEPIKTASQAGKLFSGYGEPLSQEGELELPEWMPAWMRGAAEKLGGTMAEAPIGVTAGGSFTPMPLIGETTEEALETYAGAMGEAVGAVPNWLMETTLGYGLEDVGDFYETGWGGKNVVQQLDEELFGGYLGDVSDFWTQQYPEIKEFVQTGGESVMPEQKFDVHPENFMDMVNRMLQLQKEARLMKYYQDLLSEYYEPLDYSAGGGGGGYYDYPSGGWYSGGGGGYVPSEDAQSFWLNLARWNI